MSQRPTLDELDPPAWGDPTFSSHLVTTCHALRKKPLADFETEDLRMMIGQGIGLQWLMPLAIELLEDDPWAAGAFYEGDLLVATVGVGDDYWASAPKLLKRIRSIVDDLDGRRFQGDKSVSTNLAEFQTRYPAT